MRLLLAFLILTAAIVSCPVLAQDVYRVGQKDKKFTAEELVVKKGDTVVFGNDDPFFHNVFSLSSTATFDLGSYPKGESKSVVFSETGEVEVECAIHPSMRLKITSSK